jgi:hypothetical protein
MLNVMLIVVIALLIAWIVINKPVKVQVQEVRNFQDIPIPQDLGIQEGVPLEKSVMAIQNAINEELKHKIKQLFFRDHPHVSEHEFELRFFELQRFFIMCSLLKDVPMFSDEVDEVWHTMILSTKDYEKFCHTFMGEFLHHNPAITRTPNPHGRAWFDLIYTQLFQFTKFTPMTWGGFFKYPLSQTQINELKNLSIEELKKKYFRAGADDYDVESLINQLKKQVETAEAKGLSASPGSPVFEPVKDGFKETLYLAQAMIYYSMYHIEEYEYHMRQVVFGVEKSSSACSKAIAGNGDGDGGSGCGGGCGGD